MEFAIHKKPIKVSLFGLFFLGLYFVIAVALFRSNEYFYLIMGGGLWCAAMLLMKSVGSFFISAFTVTESSIETVTPVGGIIKVNFDDLNWEKTHLSAGGLLLTPHNGEPIALSIIEFSRQDIARLAHHIGITDTDWFQEL